MKTDTIQLAHGGGGRLSRDLIQTEILPRFGQGPLRDLPDGASLDLPDSRVVFTTDSFVVRPLEFPGGNIGNLAVHGTVNDLAVCGASPLWLSLGLILEEGLPMPLLRRVLDTIRDSCSACGVGIATGDIKVVEQGRCDGMYVNTAGIGTRMPGFTLSPGRIRAGDSVIVSGNIADHGMAVLAVRDNLGFKDGPSSDSGPVHRLVSAIQDIAPSIRFMRDPTRGGLAAVVNEMASGLPVDVRIREADVPSDPRTRAVAEMLGLDLFHVASEGRVVAVCDPAVTAEVIDRWRKLSEGSAAGCIGTVTAGSGRVVIETLAGGTRLLDVPAGELLPRIC